MGYQRDNTRLCRISGWCCLMARKNIARGVLYFFMIREDLLKILVWGGFAALLVTIVALPQYGQFGIPLGIALIIAGGVGTYMMSTTRQIGQSLFSRMGEMSGKMDTVSDKIDTMSGKMDTVSDKIDTMSEQLSGKMDTVSDKIDTMSEQLSGKMDTVSDKIDTMSDRLSDKIDTMSGEISGRMDAQTDILKEIRDTLKHPPA